MNARRLILVALFTAWMACLGGVANAEPCASDSECTEGTFRAFKVGQCGVIGDCAAIPDSCEHVIEPVRGCDGDRICNACDPDVSPSVNDCVVNFQDLGEFRLHSLVPGYLATDINADGMTNFQDLAIMREFFHKAPGPSALPNDCESR